ncbi:hypothetical protein [Ramlibacter alkalitolerans]|uniref:Uncharacterized protein n=1 Tax=Ramlibacter alkalitolerans TaxID=2039631 RepID=A0ABS1JUB1_9BURK|nr:hypothetical protein [Ramlibacter alkalitolerans]MBL0427880.1 hypothetical protein [Ramlibacter alkalitolerans]
MTPQERAQSFFKDPASINVELRGDTAVRRNAAMWLAALAVALGMGMAGNADAQTRGQDQLTNILVQGLKGVANYKLAGELRERGTNYVVGGTVMGVAGVAMDAAVDWARSAPAQPVQQPAYQPRTVYVQHPAYEPVRTYPVAQPAYREVQAAPVAQAPVAVTPVFQAKLVGRSRDSSQLHVRVLDGYGRDFTASTAHVNDLPFQQSSGTLVLPTMQAAEILKSLGVYEDFSKSLTIERVNRAQQLSKAAPSKGRRSDVELG